MPRLNSAPVRLDNGLLAQVKIQASAGNRSLPAEIEARLRDSLDRGAWGEIEPGFPAQAQALGHLVTFVTHELTAYSPPEQQAEYVRRGIDRIVARLYPPATPLPDPAHEAETFADYWWLRLRNAGEQIYVDGKAAPASSEQRALSEIWKQLVVPKSARHSKESK